MKGRESGMPDEDYWSGFFDPARVVDMLIPFDDIGQGDIAEFGTGQSLSENLFGWGLAREGWNVTGIDLSEPMLAAAKRRAVDSGQIDRLSFDRASMDRLPMEDNRFDFIVAHGIWNLARSVDEFWAAVQEAARIAKLGAALFVYAFSRSTLPPETEPVCDETFVFTDFDGRPRCFLTTTQLIEELDAVGFSQEPGCPINEHLRQFDSSKLAILEGIFRQRG